MEGGDGDAGGGAVEVGAEVEAEDVGRCQITYPHNKYPPPGVGGLLLVASPAATAIPMWGSVVSRCFKV